MASGNTLMSDFVDPQILADAVNGYIPGLPVMAGTGAVVIYNTLPNTQKGGDTVTIPVFNSLGMMQKLNDGDTMGVQQLGTTGETSTVQRYGLSVNVTDMVKQLDAYADPIGQAKYQFGLSVMAAIDQAAIDAANATTPPPQMNLSVYNATTPVQYSYDLYVKASGGFGDEIRGLCAQAMHSVTLTRLRALKDGLGRPLLNVLRQDWDKGLVEFEGMPPCYMSDRMPVLFPVTSVGSSPPVLTIVQSPAVQGDFQIVVAISTGAGTGLGAVQYKISTDGGNTFPAGFQTIPSSGIVDLSATLGLLLTFAAGPYDNSNVYTSVPQYTTLLLKRGAIVSWSSPWDGDEWRDPLRTATIFTANLLAVTHAYSRLPGMVRGGIVKVTHN